MNTSTLVAVGLMVSLTVGAANWGHMQWFQLMLRSTLAAAGSVLALIASRRAVVAFVDASNSDWSPEDESLEPEEVEAFGRSASADGSSANQQQTAESPRDSVAETDLDAQQIADVISQQMNN